jgi:hypothetical protein
VQVSSHSYSIENTAIAVKGSMAGVMLEPRCDPMVEGSKQRTD